MKKILKTTTALLLLVCIFATSALAAPLDYTGNTSFIKQGKSTCKATSLAMALNIITGGSYTTASLGNNCCTNIDGKSYKGRDGATYKATYKRDTYVGSYNEEYNALNTAVSAGIPAIAAVHSTISGKTKHHWVLIVGKRNGDFLVVDPAKSGSGSIANNVRTMSELKYTLGLTDYSSTHYGYITFKCTSGSSGSGSNSYSNTSSSSNSNKYFRACSSSCNTITKGLNNIGVNSAYSYRVKIAAKNNISNYRGTASQNTYMLSLLKQGRLLKP